MSIAPSAFTLSIFFKICTQLADDHSLQLAKRVFHSMPMIHRKNTVVVTCALKMFMQRGEISLGEKIFAQMNKDMKSYGVMMSGKKRFPGQMQITSLPLLLGYLKNNRAQQAIDLFFTVDKPDSVAYFLFFNACAQLANNTALVLGKRVFLTMPKQYQGNKTTYAVLDMFIRCDDLDSAENLFRQLKRYDLLQFNDETLQPKKST